MCASGPLLERATTSSSVKLRLSASCLQCNCHRRGSEDAGGYPFAAAAAQALGHELSRTQFWLAVNGDFADEAASRWSGDRLALEDLTGRELGVNNLVVVEFPAPVGGSAIRVVADFRPDMARVEAFLRTISPGGGRTRPAA